MQVRRSLPKIIALLIVAGCAPTEKPYPSLTNVPVVHDPRAMYALFSWAHDGDFQFALFREPPTSGGEIGVARNEFLDRYDSRHTTGLDLASLEEKLKVVPTSSRVDWFIDDGRRLILPPDPVVQRIKAVIRDRKATLNLDNIKDWMS
jgi:hypothetical protein